MGEIVRNYEIDGVQFDDYFYPQRTKPLTSRPMRPIVPKRKEWNCAFTIRLAAGQYQCDGVAGLSNSEG
ncbi:MAG: hypothetical protein ACLRXC_04580 [[Clostridium] leptum]